MVQPFYVSGVQYWLAVEMRRRPPFQRRRHVRPFDNVRVLVLVEGKHDIEFLRRISLVLREADARFPNLVEMEQDQELVFLPTGGNPKLWGDRLAAFHLPEVHVLDGETSYTTEARQRIAAAINKRARCSAFVTNHRSLENYLHPHAIEAVSGLKVEFGGMEDVPALVAKGMYEALLPATGWEDLPPRTRKRGCEKAKKWLNTDAVEAMTPELLAERDSLGEISAWLTTIAERAGQS